MKSSEDHLRELRETRDHCARELARVDAAIAALEGKVVAAPPVPAVAPTIPAWPQWPPMPHPDTFPPMQPWYPGISGPFYVPPHQPDFPFQDQIICGSGVVAPVPVFAEDGARIGTLCDIGPGLNHSMHLTTCCAVPMLPAASQLVTYGKLA